MPEPAAWQPESIGSLFRQPIIKTDIPPQILWQVLASTTVFRTRKTAHYRAKKPRNEA
ncbi:hypothetical protein RvVAR031_26730 [Agrobacterium vitis]|nr:hypothetical protein RvVAR031_26730 [Agrobacterium vitis]